MSIYFILANSDDDHDWQNVISHWAEILDAKLDGLPYFLRNGSWRINPSRVI